MWTWSGQGVQKAIQIRAFDQLIVSQKRGKDQGRDVTGTYHSIPSWAMRSLSNSIRFSSNQHGSVMWLATRNFQHQCCQFMMTSSNGTIFHVTGPVCGEFTGPGEFPAQRPVTRSFDVFYDLRLNKRLSKQPWGWGFETHSPPLWRHSNVENHIEELSSTEWLFA